MRPHWTIDVVKQRSLVPSEHGPGTSLRAARPGVGTRKIPLAFPRNNFDVSRETMQASTVTLIALLDRGESETPSRSSCVFTRRAEYSICPDSFSKRAQLAFPRTANAVSRETAKSNISLLTSGEDATTERASWVYPRLSGRQCASIT